ncbi:hypothetical protein [Actinacidiphila yanglinensis]|uniref:hypothetical protein n=1 Tax=Actinacidiphila yanglinensis TaxID=310779 RepID=UPI002246A864|nr:hypothetical protein [Actinacidiphila yanglinensis]
MTAVRDYHAVAVTYDLTVASLHSYYVLAGTTPVLVHNCGSGPSDELLDLAEGNIGKTNVASEVTASNGAKGYGVSVGHDTSTLTRQVRQAVEETSRRGGCAEVEELCDLESQGAPLAGAGPAAVNVAGGSQGYDYTGHGDNLFPCPACQRMFKYLDEQG